MKELFKLDKLIEKQSVESVVKKKKEVEYKLEGTIRPLKGHSLYEINTKTLKVNPASYIEKKDITWWDAIRFMKTGYKKDVKVNKDCVYISALNPKSALKRYKENKGSAVIPDGKLEIKLF